MTLNTIVGGIAGAAAVNITGDTAAVNKSVSGVALTAHGGVRA